MRRKLFSTLIFLFVVITLVSCGTKKDGTDIGTESVVGMTEEVAEEILPLPASETEQTEELKETEKIKPDKTEKTQGENKKDEGNREVEYCPPEESERNEEETLTCTLSVRCTTVFDNISKLNKDKKAILPQDGIIFPKTKVVFYSGESVFNVLTRELKKNRIHIDFVNTPMYNTVYIRGISNLYERDCGEFSGWVYMVNGEVASCGCSQYMLQDGDEIAFVYTCDLGKDVN